MFMCLDFWDFSAFETLLKQDAGVTWGWLPTANHVDQTCSRPQGFLLTHTLSFCWIAETEGTPNLPLLSPNLEWIHILLLKITSCSIHRYFSEYEQGNQHANHCESEHEMPDQQKPCCCPVKAHAGRWVWLTFNFGFSWENENILFLTENFCQWHWKPWRCNSASLSDLYRFFEAWFEHCIMVAEMWTRD